MKNVKIEPFLHSLPYPSLLLAPSDNGYVIIATNAALNSIVYKNQVLAGSSVQDAYGAAGEKVYASVLACVKTNAVQSVNKVKLEFASPSPLNGANAWYVQHSPIPVAADMTYVLQTLQQTRQCNINICADELLSQSEKRYEELFNNSLVPLWIYDVDTLAFLQVNDLACSIYGYTHEEFANMTLRDIRPAEDLPKMEAALAVVRNRDRTVLPSVHRHIKKDGSIIYVKIESSPVVFSGHEARMTMATDITAELNAQHEMADTNQRLQAASHIAHLGYWSNDLNGKIVWSDELYKIFGVSADDFELSLPNIVGRFHPDDVTTFESDVQALFEGKEFREHERRIITRDGQTKWVFERLRMIRDESGVAIRLEGIALDVTKRKLDEAAIMQSNERFGLVMSATAEAIVDWDIANDVVVWGDAFRDLFGYNLDVYDNELWSRNIHSDDKERVMRTLSEAVADKERKRYYVEFRFLKADGSIAYVQHRAIFLRDRDGRAIRGIGAMADVTESMLRTRDIERQNEILREIAWIQSHVVRAPLASLMGLANLLKDSDEFELDKGELVDNILIAANKLDEVIHTIVRKSELLDL